MSSPLFPPSRPPRKYKIETARLPMDIIEARVLAYLSTHGPCSLHDFGRCDGLARVSVEDLANAISLLIRFEFVRMWYDRVLIRNDEGKPSIGRIPMFALTASAEGGDA